MKKTPSVLLALSLLLPSSALASTADAIIIAPYTEKLTAPFTGMLLPFDVLQGDEVRAGEILFTMDAAPVYAGRAGTVSAVFAARGDDARAVTEKYGGIAVIEAVPSRYIDAGAESVTSDSAKWIHAGETLTLRSGSERGEGRVMWVQGQRYAIEILSGHFDLNDVVRCYRGGTSTGRGTVRRMPDVSVAAAGRISDVHVKAGDTVSVGDLLFETIGEDSPKDADRMIEAPVDGAVTKLAVSSGSQVLRGQLLCEIADLSRLQLSCDLDELDFSRVHTGDTLSYTLDAYPGESFTGEVLQIRPIGEKRTNASYFDLRISLPDTVPLLPGMNGTVTIPE